jgi:hypothetical protein
VDERAAGVMKADTTYISQDAVSTAAVAAVFHPMISE